MLTFEGQQFQGVTNIVEKLTVCFFSHPQSLPFKSVRHHVSTVDAQPSNPQLGSIFVMITGQLLVHFIANFADR